MAGGKRASFRACPQAPFRFALQAGRARRRIIAMKVYAGNVALALVGARLGGCGDGAGGPAPQPLPVVELSTAGVKPSADAADLAAVLAEAATTDGRVDPKAMHRLAGRLDSQLRTMAVSGPTATPALYPTYGARWAYWYNARAAWAMKLTLLAGCPRETDSRCMARRPVPLDGRVMSLEAVDELLLAEAKRTGDFRLAACVPGVRVEYGPMPQRPYEAADFGDRLVGMFSTLIADQRRVVIDVATRTVLVGPMLWARRQDVIDQYRREFGGDEIQFLTALRPYVRGRALKRLQQAVGYDAAEAARTGELAIPRRRVYFPGKIGRVEPP